MFQSWTLPGKIVGRSRILINVTPQYTRYYIYICIRIKKKILSRRERERERNSEIRYFLFYIFKTGFAWDSRREPATELSRSVCVYDIAGNTICCSIFRVRARALAANSALCYIFLSVWNFYSEQKKNIVGNKIGRRLDIIINSIEDQEEECV